MEGYPMKVGLIGHHIAGGQPLYLIYLPGELLEVGRGGSKKESGKVMTTETRIGRWN